MLNLSPISKKFQLRGKIRLNKIDPNTHIIIKNKTNKKIVYYLQQITPLTLLTSPVEKPPLEVPSTNRELAQELPYCFTKSVLTSEESQSAAR